MSGLGEVLDEDEELLEGEDEEVVDKTVQGYITTRDLNLQRFDETGDSFFKSIADFYDFMIDTYDCQVTEDEIDDVKIEGTQREAPRDKYKDELKLVGINDDETESG